MLFEPVGLQPQGWDRKLEPTMSSDRSVTTAVDDLRSRRDLLAMAGALALFGIGAATWPLIDSMNPSAELQVPSWIDLRGIEIGQRKTVVWRDTPIFIVHRTPQEIAAARADDDAEMPFPEADGARVQRDEWLIVIGICTFRPCPLLEHRSGENSGAWHGWICPCHANAYDLAGRLRVGPGNRNLDIPPYRFESDTAISLGTSRLQINS